MSRLFTFGCSFTQYMWPTWADILGRQFSYYENWGKSGGGNQYIFNSLIECHLLNQLTKEDTVIIMWTSPDREDRYINGTWQTPGGLANQTFYSKDFINKYYDERGSVFRDLTSIKTTKDLLDFWGINYRFLSMMPFNNYTDNDLLKVFDPILKSIRVSAYEICYNNSWLLPKNTSNFVSGADKERHIELLKDQYHNLKGADWPSFSDFIDDKISDVYKNEMKELNLLYLRDYNIRNDGHPVPTEHLHYLKTVLPEFIINKETESWVDNYKLFDKFDSHQPNYRL